ncbi:hypothetical protein ACFSCX_02490 [Bacillus salitolerans]|uniref:DOD-type homing endonuclease domain-containing protein n=1 Tax=Bacillus salitolerans TaxID=1437434 RepID=A0ABW4LJY0_9BACI
MEEEVKKILLDRDELYKLYITDDFSIRDIAKILDVSEWTAREYLNKKHGIYKSLIKPDPNKHITEQFLSNKEWMQNEYLIKRKSAYQIARELDVKYGRVDRWICNHGFYGLKTFKNTCNESMFNYKNPIFCYFAGYVATDGYIDIGTTPRVSLRSNDKCSEQLFRMLANYFEFTGQIRLYKKSYDLTITSQKLVNELNNHFNITNAKTKTLRFPNYFFNDKCASMFFRGVIDGDGNIRKDGGVRIYCGSNDFMDGSIAFLNTQFNWRVKKTYVSKKYPGFSLSGLKSKQLLDWVYRYDTTYLLQRKYERYLTTSWPKKKYKRKN